MYWWQGNIAIRNQLNVILETSRTERIYKKFSFTTAKLNKHETDTRLSVHQRDERLFLGLSGHTRHIKRSKVVYSSSTSRSPSPTVSPGLQWTLLTWRRQKDTHTVGNWNLYWLNWRVELQCFTRYLCWPGSSQTVLHLHGFDHTDLLTLCNLHTQLSFL